MNDERTPHSNGHSTDPWESEMSREFDKRVRDLHEAPLSFENVRGKAMTIRRNRRIAVAGGILAAAAVVVPVAVFAGNGLGDSNGNIDPAAPTVTRATDPNDPTPSQPAVGTLGIDYLEGATWHRADGSTVELDTRYDGGTVVGDELLGVRNNNGRLTIDVVDGEGAVADSLDSWTYPVADADHTEAAWINRDGQLVVRSEVDQLSVSTDLVDGDSVVAVVDGRVFITHGDGSQPEVIEPGTSSAAGNEVIALGAVRLNDVTDDGLAAAQVSSSDAGSCSAVYDATGSTQVDTCTYSFDDFSPDGAYLSGTDAYRDGIGMGYVVILDARTGDELARWEANEGFASTWVWEDDTHLLINAYESGEWRVYRFGVDGTAERVLRSTEGDDMTPAFTLLGG